MGVASRTCLAHLSRDILDTSCGQPSQLRSLFLENWLDIKGAYEFHSNILYCEASRRKLFTKIPFLPLVLEATLFRSLLKMNDRR